RRHLRLVLIKLGLEEVLLDREEKVALLDLLAFPEMHLFEEAFDTRQNVDLGYRLDAADELIPLGDRALLQRHDADSRRRRRGIGLLRLLLIATAGQCQGTEGGAEAEDDGFLGGRHHAASPKCR